MKDILLYMSDNGFVQGFVNTFAAGVIAGFGVSMTLSLIGYGSHKTFNLIERSAK